MRPVERKDWDERSVRALDRLDLFAEMIGPLKPVFLPASFYLFDCCPDVARYEFSSALAYFLDCVPVVVDVARHY